MHDSEEPVDGDLIDAWEARVGDYLFAYHESDGTASWLQILAVAPVEGATLVTFGRGAGVTDSYPSDRQAWVLRKEAAAVLVRTTSDRVLTAWGEPEQSMEAFLRSFATQADLVRGWPFEVPSLADALTAWDLLREADAANSADVAVAVTR